MTNIEVCVEAVKAWQAGGMKDGVIPQLCMEFGRDTVREALRIVSSR